MTVVLLASDSDHVFAEVDATLATDDCEVLRVRKGSEVLPVVEAKKPDLVILDMQIGAMGGIATCIAIRQEEGADRLPIVAVALLLDRDADVFLAQQADADGWLIKPLDSLRLRKLSKQLLAGEDYFEGVPVEAAEASDADPQTESEVAAGAES